MSYIELELKLDSFLNDLNYIYIYIYPELGKIKKKKEKENFINR